MSGSTNTVEANYIGVGPDGVSPRILAFNSGFGFYLFHARDNTIGGTNAGEGNVIAHQAYGILVFGSNATRTAIFGNTTYSNIWNGTPNVGIDLAGTGGADGSAATCHAARNSANSHTTWVKGTRPGMRTGSVAPAVATMPVPITEANQLGPIWPSFSTNGEFIKPPALAGRAAWLDRVTGRLQAARTGDDI